MQEGAEMLQSGIGQEVDSGGREPATPGASASICTLREWLSDMTLHIPDYQRPYKWGSAHVQQLLQDVEQQTLRTDQEAGASSYRMGTVVVHVEPLANGVNGVSGVGHQPQPSMRRNIVDGQQRTLTLLLMLHALRNMVTVLPPQRWQHDLLALELFEPQLPHAESQRQVQANYQEIARHIRQAQWGQAQVQWLLERCEVVRVELYSLTEAFQFFDAQNGRGKSLCVHDLLKAYHLRAMRHAELPLRKQAVQAWERCSQNDLERLFARFLFQTRQRSRGRDAEYFGKRHLGVFKGINLDEEAAPRLSQAWRMLDDLVHLLEKQAGAYGQKWPCQLDAPIVNGLRFFDWVQHYWRMGFHEDQAYGDLPLWAKKLKHALSADAQDILRTLGRYSGRDHKGDSHVRAVFDALLMYYLDKFGEQHLSRAVVIAFAWAYARLLNRRVMVGSMDKFVSEGRINPFEVLRDAVTPQDFLGMDLPLAHWGPSYQSAGRARPKGLHELQKLMQALGYWKLNDAQTPSEAQSPMPETVAEQAAGGAR